MSKYPCKLIEDLIPLYIEDDVSDETKEIVEEHIEECNDCRKLVEEYTNDELKLSGYQEDMPHANTFKKWMKSLKAWVSIAAIGILITLIAIGGLGYKIGETNNYSLLTINTIVTTFEKEGLHLKKDNSKPSDAFDLNGVEPAVYKIDKTEGTLLVYTFKSFVERDDILSETNKFNNPFSLEEVPYDAKNALIVYMPSKIPTSIDELKSFSEIRKTIDDIVFKYLNDGKEIIYKGESDHWDGTVTLKYYENWWQDEKGTLHYDNYYTQYPIIRYKMADIKDVGSISFEYKTTHGGGKATGLNLDDKGYANPGRGGGNGAIPRKDDVFNVTIKWNGGEENFTLKAQQ